MLASTAHYLASPASFDQKNTGSISETGCIPLQQEILLLHSPCLVLCQQILQFQPPILCDIFIGGATSGAFAQLLPLGNSNNRKHFYQEAAPKSAVAVAQCYSM